MLPYASQTIDDEDVAQVLASLRSAFLTTGPAVKRFEQAVAEFVGANYGVALSSGTAALHAAMFAIDIQPGDEVIVPAITFVATANCVVYQGGVPIFADVDPDTLLIDPQQLERLITNKTRAIIAVDYAGQACDYATLRQVADRYHLHLVADASHALGASFNNHKIGSLADLSTFSFHPVKPITTGEGGMVTTANAQFAERVVQFRNHGIDKGAEQRAQLETWDYNMLSLGFNYRISDFQCALGLQQLTKLPQWIDRRNSIAAYYSQSLESLAGVAPLKCLADRVHAFHLYVVKLKTKQLRCHRDEFLSALKAEGIGANVHFKPVYMHPYYQTTFHTTPGLCPQAEHAYEQIITLPLYPAMSYRDAEDVVMAMKKLLAYYCAE